MAQSVTLLVCFGQMPGSNLGQVTDLYFSHPFCKTSEIIITPWLQSACGLYQPRDRRLSAKLLSTFANRGVSRSQRGGSPTAVI
jgi:hypothetical protein